MSRTIDSPSITEPEDPMQLFAGSPDMTVRLTWSSNQYRGSPKDTNMAWLVKHGGTIRIYVNTGREEAERRFHADIESQPKLFSLSDGPEAIGEEMPFIDELVLWTNAGEQLSGAADALMRQFYGGPK